VDEGQVDRRGRIVGYGYLAAVIAGATAVGYGLAGPGGAVGAGVVAALAAGAIVAVMRRMGRL
jgi:hypothetical protein